MQFSRARYSRALRANLSEAAAQLEKIAKEMFETLEPAMQVGGSEDRLAKAIVRTAARKVAARPVFEEE